MVSEALKKWRNKQKKGDIMKPSTFRKIEEKAKNKYGAKRAESIAGSAYWKTAKSKFRNSKKVKDYMK